MTKKKILIVTECLGIDGPERVISELSSEWRKEGHDVTIVLTCSKERNATYEITNDITTIAIDSKGIKPIKLLKDALKIRKLLRTDMTIVGVSLMLSTSFSLSLAGIGLKNKIVLSERNDPHKVPFKWYQRKMRDLSLWLADSCVFQTEDARKYFCNRIQRKGRIILNPVNPLLPNPFDGVRRKEFVAVGRLARQKNFPLLINSFKVFNERISDYKLTIYGEGPERADLQVLIDKHGLSEIVKMPGFSTNVYEKIVDCIAYVSSSDFEGMSNSMLEAMSMGMTVICTDCPIGGARQVIKSGENGLLVPTGSVDAMMAAMIEVVENPELARRMAANASDLRYKLNVETISKHWLTLF